MGEVTWVVKNPETIKYYNFSDAEWGLSSSSTARARAPRSSRSTGASSRARTSPRSLVLDFEEMLRKIDLIEQSVAERNLSLLAGAKTARQRAAEEKAEGRNIFFIPFHVLDPDRFLNRTVRYVRWIWTPPGRARVGARRDLDGRHLHPPLAAHLVRDARALRLPVEAAPRRHPVLPPALDHRLHPRVRPRLRDQDLRRRGPRHRHRPALLHAGLLLRHDRLAALREQVAPPLGRRRRGSTSRASSASRRRCSGSSPTPTASCTSSPTRRCSSRASRPSSSTSTRSSRSTATTRSRACSRFRSCARSRSSTSARSSSGRSCACPSRSPSISRRKRRIFWIYGPLALAYIGVIMTLHRGPLLQLLLEVLPEPRGRPASRPDPLRLFRKRVRLVTRTARLFYLDKKDLLMSPRSRKPLIAGAVVLLSAARVPWTHRKVRTDVRLRPANRGVAWRRRRTPSSSRCSRRKGTSVAAGQPVLRLESPAAQARGPGAPGRAAARSRRTRIARAAGATRLGVFAAERRGASVESALASDAGPGGPPRRPEPDRGDDPDAAARGPRGPLRRGRRRSRRGGRLPQAARPISTSRSGGSTTSRRRGGRRGDVSGPAAAARGRTHRLGLGGDARAARDGRLGGRPDRARRRGPTDSWRGPSSTTPTERCGPG